MIIGFGSTEKNFEDELEEKIRKHVIDEHVKESHQYFSEDFLIRMRNEINTLSADSLKTGEKYKIATDYPDRYSYFWGNVLSDACCIVFILTFHHINRRHAFSSDGWAMMKNERVFYVHSYNDCETKGVAA